MDFSVLPDTIKPQEVLYTFYKAAAAHVHHCSTSTGSHEVIQQPGEQDMVCIVSA